MISVPVPLRLLNQSSSFLVSVQTAVDALGHSWYSVTFLSSLGSGFLSEFVWQFPTILLNVQCLKVHF